MRFYLPFSFTCALVLYVSAGLSAQCPAGFDSVRLEINPDPYFYETHWKIREKSDTNIVYATGSLEKDSLYIFGYCIPVGGCKELVLTDDGGDGMFYDGADNDGRYWLYVNGELKRYSKGYYGPGQTTEFSCPLGTFCNNALSMQLGNFSTPNGNEAWYSFTPADTGLYVLSTCGAVCPAKIWAYDHCAGILVAENQMGTIAYAAGGCPDSSATANLLLAGGHEYFIRLRYATTGCSTSPIPYALTYAGPITGCMDSLACNYEPLATVSNGVCYYPGDPNCPQAPDLTVNEDLLVSSLEFSDIMAADPCLLLDGCVRGLGQRQVIKFITQVKNIGDADYFIGSPPPFQDEPSTQFVYDPCHGHWHYMGYAEYVLYNQAGLRIPIGTKTGFCVADAECGGGGIMKFNCVNMGLSAGCGDVYDKSVNCQWVDITDLPADNYTLVVRVNWDKSPDKIGRIEKRFDNNWAQACFSLVYDGATPEVVFNTDTCAKFTDCLGEVFGSAQPDCNGICNGPALRGDVNQDTLRNQADITQYLSTALAGNGQASSCNDLHDDGVVDVFDAALLQECNLHADSQQYWIQRFPCLFPAGFTNPDDLVTIRAGIVDTIEKTFDLEIFNPKTPLMAYELTVSGMNISGVENLTPEYHGVPQFNSVSGKVLALSTDEVNMNKHIIPTPFLRIHYNLLTNNEVCVSSITSVVNSRYQESNFSIGNPACVQVHTVAATEPVKMPVRFYVQPNPMQESTTIFFENEKEEPTTFTLRDMTGKIVRFFPDLRSNEVNIQRLGLPQGAYFFTLCGNRGFASGKLWMQ